MSQKQEDQPVNENYQFIMENGVRFAIMTALSIYNQPLNLTKLSKLTSCPTTTLIHHIPSLIEKNLIRVTNLSKKRKYYELTEEFFNIDKFTDSDKEIEMLLKSFEDTKKMSISEYKLQLFKGYSERIQQKEFTEGLANDIVTLAMINKNIATFLSENLKIFIKNFIEKKTVDLDIPITYPSNNEMTLDFSTVEQLQEFQKLNYNYIRNLKKLKEKIVQENKGIPDDKLEKSYLYLFVSPIFNISD